MRQTILLGLLALLAVSGTKEVCAQRRGGGGSGFVRGGHGFSRGRAASRFGFGYAYLPYDSDAGYMDAAAPMDGFEQPAVRVEPPEPPARPAVQPTGHPVVTEYKWSAAELASAETAPAATDEGQTFVLVLKNGSTLSAVTVFASEDGLHYVDPDSRHLRVSLSAVDRAATLKLNRGRNLNLYLPAAQ